MPDSTSSQTDRPVSAKSRLGNLAKTLSVMLLWVSFCLVGAGRFDWWRGWVCVAVYMVAMFLVGALVQRFNRGLLDARGDWKSHRMQSFDKVYLGLYLPLTYIQVLIGGMDAVRFHWLPLPLWTAAPVLLFSCWRWRF